MAAAAKVAYLLPDPGIPVGGTKGASVHVDSLCGAMASEGASVTLYAAKVTGPLSAPGSAAVTVVPLDVGPVHSGVAAERSRIAAADRFFRAVAPRLDADRPDWVHERLSLFAGAGAAVCTARRLPRIVEVNAPVAAERARHFGLCLAERAERDERRALSGARALAVSQPLAEWALSRGAGQVAVLANGADLDGLDPTRCAAAGREVRGALGFPPQAVIVGFAGSLKPWHGVEGLVKAVSAASRSGPPLALLIVGDGPRRPQVEAAVATLPARVPAVLTGAVAHRHMPAYLAAMDLAVAPYLPAETFYFSPLKVAEAMAAGRAILASDFPPVRTMIGAAGVLLPAGDVPRLTTAIRQLAADPIAREGLGRAARDLAVRGLSWRSVASETLRWASS